MNTKQVLTKAYTFVKDLIVGNFQFFIGAIVVLLLVFVFVQANRIRDLKAEVKNREDIILNERQRYYNNTRALLDSVSFWKTESVYLKTIFRAKDGEIDSLDKVLSNTKKRLDAIVKQIDKNGEVKNIYITEVSSNIETVDLFTKVKSDTNGYISVGIYDTTQVYSIETETWFKLIPDSNRLNIKFADKFGENKPSKLKYRLNFSLFLSQIELSKGKTRVMVQALDNKGYPVPPDILTLPFVNGVDFIDVKPKIIEPINTSRKTGRWGIMVGPAYGLYRADGVFVPRYGFVITAGYKIL